MEWNSEQIGGMIEDYWLQRSVRCPIDGTVLTPAHNRLGEDGYLLYFSCVRCGNEHQATQDDDPRRSTFREWTPIEIEGAVDAHFQKRAAKCPVCHTTIKVIDSLLIHGGPVNFRCPRCFNSHTWSRDKAG